MLRATALKKTGLWPKNKTFFTRAHALKNYPKNKKGSGLRPQVNRPVAQKTKYIVRAFALSARKTKFTRAFAPSKKIYYIGPSPSHPSKSGLHPSKSHTLLQSFLEPRELLKIFRSRRHHHHTRSHGGHDSNMIFLF